MYVPTSNIILSTFGLCRSRVKERSVKQWKTSNLKNNEMSISEPWSQVAPTALCKARNINSWHGKPPKSSGHKSAGCSKYTAWYLKWSPLGAFMAWVIFGSFWNISRAWILHSYTCITGPRRSACAPSPVQSWVLRAPKRQAAIDCRGLTCTYGERGLKSAINDE